MASLIENGITPLLSLESTFGVVRSQPLKILYVLIDCGGRDVAGYGVRVSRSGSDVS
jgi:hypothetical protein